MRPASFVALGLIVILALFTEAFEDSPEVAHGKEKARYEKQLAMEKGRELPKPPEVRPEDGPAIPPDSIVISTKPTGMDSESIQKRVYGPTRYQTPDGRIIDYFPSTGVNSPASTHELGFFQRHYRCGELVGVLFVLGFASSGVTIVTSGAADLFYTRLPIGGFVAIPSGFFLIGLICWYVGVHAVADTREVAEMMGLAVDIAIEIFWRLLTGTFS